MIEKSKCCQAEYQYKWKGYVLYAYCKKCGKRKNKKIGVVIPPTFSASGIVFRQIEEVK